MIFFIVNNILKKRISKHFHYGLILGDQYDKMVRTISIIYI